MQWLISMFGPLPFSELLAKPRSIAQTSCSAGMANIYTWRSTGVAVAEP